MKIKKEDYEHMKRQISLIASDIPKHRQTIITEGKAKDIEKRLRWDIAFFAQLTNFFCTDLYSYCDDSHIDTALKQIMREVSK